MRRLVAAIDQAPGWRFVLGALVLLASVKGWWMIAQLSRNPGAAELGGLVLLAGSIVLSIFAIRRRQTGIWDASAQVIATIAGANLLSYAFLIPVLPPGGGGQLASLVRAGLGETLVGVGLAIPVQAAGLWLSRRYGSHSSVTERRLRAVRGDAGHGAAARRATPSPQAGGDGEGAPPSYAPMPTPAPEQP